MNKYVKMFMDDNNLKVGEERIKKYMFDIWEEK